MDAEKLNQANSKKIFVLDKERLGVRIEYYSETDRFLGEIFSYTTPEVVFNVNVEVNDDNVIENKIAVKFYTNKDHLFFDSKSDDYLFVNPEKKELNGWVFFSEKPFVFEKPSLAELYDNIFYKMKFFGGLCVDNFSEEHKEIHLNHIKQFQNNESKESFLTKYVRELLLFDLAFPKIKSFVESWLADNPDYKYARVFKLK